MGRYSYSSKDRADSLKKIEMPWLKKHGYVYNNYSFERSSIKWTYQDGRENSISFEVSTTTYEKKIRIYYTITDRQTGEKRDIDYTMPIVSTPCHFGGVRYWFKCSLSRDGVYCGRRVGTVYMGGDYFACRHCYDLAYESQYKSNGAISRIVRIFDSWEKIEKIEKTMKRRFYNGKPTRKMRRIMKIEESAEPYIRALG